MKKIFCLIILLAFTLRINDLKALEIEDCTRTWAKAYNFINSNYNSQLADCAASIAFNWVTLDPIGAAFDMGCAMEATWLYNQLLDNAADQYGACISIPEE